jgi:phospholipid/cholesterol/gamma-HCH transport system substrate-binding protein
METKANYTIVGLFVVCLSIGAIACAIWLGGFYKKDLFNYYYTEFHESVSGLNKDAPVKYMGVTIGSVKDIRIDPLDPTTVKVVLEIQRDVAILEGMYTTLNFTGITGIAYVEIKGGNKGAPLLMAKGQELPVIPSKPSLFAAVEMSAMNLAAKLERTLEHIERLLGEENTGHITGLLRHLDELSGRIANGFTPQTAEDIRLTIKNLSEISQKLNTMTTDIQQITPVIKEVSQHTNITMQRLASTSANVDTLSQGLVQRMQAGEYDIKPMLAPSILLLNETLYDTRNLVLSINEEIKAIGNSPSDLFFKKSRSLLGPGEELER